jgi:hypothetical protein
MVGNGLALIRKIEKKKGVLLSPFILKVGVHLEFLIFCSCPAKKLF